MSRVGARHALVLLAGSCDATNIVFHYLRGRFGDLEVILEEPVPRMTLARRRAKRLGWPTVAGQIAFVGLAMPYLEWRSRDRVRQILAENQLDPSPIAEARRVGSVNAPEALELLVRLRPRVVVVNGTRIISSSVLEAATAAGATFVNTHAGITPRYRGVHGGYWALAEGRPDLVGTTIHAVDPGIDTGAVLRRAYFRPEKRDSIATYPYLHLAAGLPALGDVVEALLRCEDPGTEAPTGETEELSLLRWHPTLWGYLSARLARGVR